MNHLPQLRVLVLGLGTSGLAMARWCASHGAQLRVWDSRTQAPQAEALRAEHPDVAVFSGDLTANDLADVQLVRQRPAARDLIGGRVDCATAMSYNEFLTILDSGALKSKLGGLSRDPELIYFYSNPV